MRQSRTKDGLLLTEMRRVKRLESILWKKVPEPASSALSLDAPRQQESRWVRLPCNPTISGAFITDHDAYC